VTFLEGRCLSYSRNIAYHPIVDVLRANSDIQDTDTDQVIRDKVTRFLKALNIDEASTLPYLLELLSVKDSGIDKIQMSPEARKDRTLEALKRITLKGAEYRHIIMAIEDLHWMDRSSEDALKELLESIPGARVFLIFTYRPEFIHTWGSRSYHSQVTLNKLSNRESLAMIEHVLATRDIDRHLEDLILQKAEGIPFFIEEFVKSLKDLKIIECRNGAVTLIQDIKSVSIPSTIQEVIMARIDKLPVGAREVLRAGSVIEREFSHKLIKKVTDLPEQELLSQLSALKDAELLYERGIYPQSTYIFKHALTREVAYDSILTKRKKQIHEKIATTIEDIYKDDICYHYGVLSGHCIASEKYEKGAEYARLEAKRYQKAALFKDAVEYAKRSIRCLEKLPLAEATQKKIIDGRTTLANYHLNLSQNLEAKNAVEPIMDLAERLNYHKRLPGIYSAMGLYYLWSEEDFTIGFPYIQKALKISEEVGDYLSLYMASILSGYYLHYECEFEKALIHFKKSLELSEITNNKMGITASKAAMSQMYTFQGNIDLAFKAGKESLDIVKESGDIFFKGIGYSAYGCALYYMGMLSEAEGYLLEGLDFCDKTSQAAWGSWTACHLGCMYFDIGDYIKAEEFLKKIISTFENANFLFSWSHMNKSGLTKTKIRNYNRDVDLNELLDNFNSVKIKVGKGWYARNVGDVLLNIDDDHLTDSEVWIKKAMDADTHNGTRWQLASDHILYADWFKKKGDIQGAKEQLTKAIDIFKECRADGWVTRTQESLAKLA
jgi:tetratricopeptide (TPR) repeat protein